MDGKSVVMREKRMLLLCVDLTVKLDFSVLLVVRSNWNLQLLFFSAPELSLLVLVPDTLTIQVRKQS